MGSRPKRAADVARGTTSGCDAALRPHGRARVARTGRKRRIGRGHMAGGHAITRSTCALVWGATWQAGKWRAHGNSGPWLDVWGGNAISVYSPLIYSGTSSSFFRRVGLCSHTVLTFAGDVDARRALDSVRTAEIAVHAIIKSRHVSIKNDVSPMIGHAFCSD